MAAALKPSTCVPPLGVCTPLAKLTIWSLYWSALQRMATSMTTSLRSWRTTMLGWSVSVSSGVFSLQMSATYSSSPPRWQHSCTRGPPPSPSPSPPLIWRQSMSVMLRPALRKACSSKRVASVSKLSSPAEAKIDASGRKVTAVPLVRPPPPSSSGSVLMSRSTTPLANAIVCRFPPRATSTSSRSLSAFTTEMPTPCSPALTLYPVSCPPNLPPACRTVSTVSSAGRPVFSCKSHGIPRPSSCTVTLPSACSSTSIAVACPASASSTELSTTS